MNSFKIDFDNGKTVNSGFLNSSAVDSQQIPISVRYCRMECFITFFYCGMFLVFDTFAVSFAIWLFPNKYQLPMNFCINGLPFAGISWQWAINYVLQVPMLYFSTNFYTIYFFSTLVLLNHLSWMIDCSLTDIENLNNALNYDEDSLSHQQKFMTTSRLLRKVTVAVENILSWQKETSVFLQLSFLAIFVSQSSLSCFYLFALSNNPSDSFLAMFGMMFTLSELYVCCWMGSQVTQRLNQLTISLHCINWDRMVPSHRRELVLTLLITQNIKSFNGVFKRVELMTFVEVRCICNIDLKAKNFLRQVVQFSYTFLAILRATGSSV